MIIQTGLVKLIGSENKTERLESEQGTGREEEVYQCKTVIRECGGRVIRPHYIHA